MAVDVARETLRSQPSTIKRTGTAYALSALILVGLGGIHRFYLGRPWTGLLWLLTLGLLGVGQLYDILTMKRQVQARNLRDGILDFVARGGTVVTMASRRG